MRLRLMAMLREENGLSSHSQVEGRCLLSNQSGTVNVEAFCETLMQLLKEITLLLDNARKPKQAISCCIPQIDITTWITSSRDVLKALKETFLTGGVEIEESQTAHCPTEDLCCIRPLDYAMKAMVKAGMPDGM